MQNKSQSQSHNVCWTPVERDDWILQSVSSADEKGTRNGYTFNTMAKQPVSALEQEDFKRVFVTGCLAKTLYNNHPLLKRLSLCFYKAMMFKIQHNSFLALMQRKRNFVVMVKGSNAYKLLLRHVPHENVVDYSDLDISVFINPHLDDATFKQIRDSLIVLISQVMSRYKKDLDATFFTDEENPEESILKKPFVATFKDIYNTMLKECEDEGYKVVSPFENNRVRNLCSKRSFVILDSVAQTDHVVRVEVPHLPKCEFIPLRKTPLVLSHNKTIIFQRDVEGKYMGHFDLIRLRLNNAFVLTTNKGNGTQDDNHSDCSTETSHIEEKQEPYHYKQCKIVPADFIDVSVPYKDDAELLDFWRTYGYNRCYEIYDRFVGANIMIPNINECIRDLSNILNVYTNSHMKMEKRQKRLEMFKLLDENRKKLSDINDTQEDTQYV